MKYYAIIDAGSNSFRLLVKEVDENGVSDTVIKEKSMVRLAEGMEKDGFLQENAMKRAEDALIDFKKRTEDFSDIEWKLIGTAAIRNAKNGQDFLKRVKAAIGLEMEVISGEKEAYYNYLAVTTSLKVESGIIVDTGGASCEIIVIENNKLKHLTSLPFGAVTLTEAFFKDDNRSGDALFRGTMYIEEKLKEVEWFMEGVNLPIYATGGSNRCLAKVYRNRLREQNNLLALHGLTMTKKEVYSIFSDILSKDKNERKQIRGLSKERSDIIIGGLLPVITIIKMLDSPKLIVSEQGLREGVLLEQLGS
ncbi:MAG: Ppx/GppA family phosphatase [Bacillus sp. (in: firmicutes)]